MGWAIYYHIQNGEAAILRCVGDDAPLVLPETIEGCPVTAIGPDCFGAGGTETEDRLIPAEPDGLPPVSRAEGALCRIALPETIRSIGDRAFARCRKLQRLTLPARLETLGVRAFDQCGSLEHIELPDGVTQLPDYAFSQCRKLERVALSPRTTALGHHAFYHCVALKSLDIPDGVTFVGGGLFLNCKSLSRLALPLGVNLSALVSDLTNDLDLTVRYPDGAARFFLPGFSYEYEDINAPRMWRTITYGSGQLYRECFSSRDVDFDLYESYFDLALKQDDVKDTVRIAWYRLRWPYGRNRGRGLYLAHVTEHCDVLLRLLMEEEDLEGLEAMLAMLHLTSQQLDRLSALANRAGKVRFVSALLNARMGLGGGADKEFDL